jgi:hypothetical protein
MGFIHAGWGGGGSDENENSNSENKLMHGTSGVDADEIVHIIHVP